MGGKFDKFRGDVPALPGAGKALAPNPAADAIARIRDRVRDPRAAERLASGVSRFAIALDATGSMAGLIGNAVRAIGEIMKRVHQEIGHRVEIEIFVFRDYDVGELVLQRSGPSADPTELREWLEAIVATGGGANSGEAIEAALAPLLSEGEIGAILLAGDEPSNGRQQLAAHGRRETATAQDLAAALGKRAIPVHTFVVGADPATIADFETLSRLSGGVSGRLDGSAEMIDLAVLSIIASLKGAGGIRSYMSQHRLSDNATRFGERLLLGKV